MNIAKLISPIALHNRKAKQKKQTLDNQNTQQLHTPISIPNELPYHQRLYFKQSEFFKNNTECQSQNTQPEMPKFKKIDSTLNQIDKLKSQFAKRLKTQNYSEQKLISKSNQRHLLKPSAAPKIGIATSEFTVACFGNEKNERNTIKEETFSFQVEARSPEEEQFNDDFQNNHPVLHCNPSNKNIKCIGENQILCNCRSEFSSFIETMRAKMDNIAQKIKVIEQKNANFKKSNQKINKSKINNQQNRIKMKKYKIDAVQQQNIPNTKHYCQKSSNFINNDGSSSKINKGKMQTLLQRLQLRMQKQ